MLHSCAAHLICWQPRPPQYPGRVPDSTLPSSCRVCKTARQYEILVSAWLVRVAVTSDVWHALHCVHKREYMPVHAKVV